VLALKGDSKIQVLAFLSSPSQGRTKNVRLTKWGSKNCRVELI